MTMALQGVAARTDFFFERLIFMCVLRWRSGFCGPLGIRELRDVAVDDAFAETRFERLFLAGHLVAAARLQVLAAQAPTDADRQVRAVAALLPRAKLQERRDRLGSFRRDRGDLEAWQSRDRRTLVDAALGIDRVVVLPVQFAGAEQAVDDGPFVRGRRHVAPVDRLAQLHQRLRFLLLAAPRAGSRPALLGIDHGPELHAPQQLRDTNLFEARQQLLERRHLI